MVEELYTLATLRPYYSTQTLTITLLRKTKDTRDDRGAPNTCGGVSTHLTISIPHPSTLKAFPDEQWHGLFNTATVGIIEKELLHRYNG